MGPDRGTIMRRLILFLLLLVGCSGPPHAVDSTTADPIVDADDPFSEREKDSVRRQIGRTWVADPGLPGIETMQVIIIVELNPDGSVQSTRFDPASISNDPNWERFAEACRRAVLRSSPLQMPPDKPYAAWKTMTVRFSGRDLIGSN